jgi:hypothetical protein
MASEKNPSIYNDRGTIGSSKELDVYGVWVKSEPQEFAESPLPIPDDPPDFDLSIAVKEIPEAEDNLTELSIEDFLDAPTEGNEGETIPELEAEDPGDVPDFDNPPETATEQKPEEAAHVSGLSTQLLLKIAEELSSIKNEISSLKQELSAVRTTVNLSAADSTEETEDDAAGGLEIPALEEEITFKVEDNTGDDLTGFTIPTEFPEAEDEPILPPEETATAEDIPADADINDFIDNSPELQQLLEEGLEPMTPPPEDTDYLETDPLADAQFDETSLEDISIDLDLEDETFPIAEDEADETAEIPAEEELSFSIAVKEDAEPISLGDEEEPELSPEPAADVPAEKPLEEPPLDAPFPVESLGEDLNLDDIAFDEVSEEENFARVIPEGFEAEAEDSPLLGQDLAADDEALLPEEDLEVLSGDDADAIEDLELDPVPDEPEEAADVPAERPADKPVENDGAAQIPTGFKQELKTVLSYMDQLLESLPEEKIEEFAKSQYFGTYKKLFEELGIH